MSEKKRALRAVNNYEQKLKQLIAGGWFVPERGTVTALVIAHDPWCGVYKRRACDCDPEISVGCSR